MEKVKVDVKLNKKIILNLIGEINNNEYNLNYSHSKLSDISNSSF